MLNFSVGMFISFGILVEDTLSDHVYQLKDAMFFLLNGTDIQVRFLSTSFQ